MLLVTTVEPSVLELECAGSLYKRSSVLISRKNENGFAAETNRNRIFRFSNNGKPYVTFLLLAVTCDQVWLLCRRPFLFFSRKLNCCCLLFCALHCAVSISLLAASFLLIRLLQKQKWISGNVKQKGLRPLRLTAPYVVRNKHLI